MILEEEARAQVQKLLAMLATEVRPCKACGRTIYLCATKAGRTMPVTDDAVSHFVDCSDPGRFRKRGGGG